MGPMSILFLVHALFSSQIKADTQSIVNRHDFDYILNPQFDICGEPNLRSNSNNNSVSTNRRDIFLLVYVHSAPENFMRRQSLRETWLRRSLFKNMRVVFMMGYTSNKLVRERLELESSIYNDIVQENFVDAYKNITYKGIMAMKWISQYCNSSQHILKVDDDIISNIFIVMRHLNSLRRHEIVREKKIMCLVWIGMKVMRDKDSKWYIPKEEFADDYFGKYCSGSAYMFTNDMPPLMYNASLYTKFFWVDDYYMTGLLARAVNASYLFMNSLYIINSNLVEEKFFGKQADYTAFGHLPGKLNKIYRIWKQILKSQFKSFPSLYASDRASIVQENDFNFIKNFKWSMSVWEPYLRNLNTQNPAYDI